MSTLILNRLKAKLRQDITDGDVENLIYTYFKFDNNGEVIYQENTEMPDEIKKMLLDASNVMPDKEPEEFDLLEDPCRGSFIYEDLVNMGELLGEDKLESLGLSNKKYKR